MKMPILKLKPAKMHDLKDVMKLFSYVECNVPNKGRVKSWIEDRKVYVIKHKKRIIGAFSYSIIGFLGLFSLMYIHKLSIDPLIQGKGLGSLMLTKIKLRSIKIGVTVLILFSLKQVINFYKKNNLNNIWRFFWWRNRGKI